MKLQSPVRGVVVGGSSIKCGTMEQPIILHILLFLLVVLLFQMIDLQFSPKTLTFDLCEATLYISSTSRVVLQWMLCTKQSIACFTKNK